MLKCINRLTSALMPAMIFILCLLVWSDLYALTAARTSDILKVQLPHGGVLVGRHQISHKGRHVRAFLGIPYALPPVGELRFKPPVPYGSWLGERLAVQDSDVCIHRDPFTRQMEIHGSEDCLYLNVYTPEQPKSSKPLPVMFYIHGGGFISGSGISSYYPPDYLLDHDIILVSGNYRLGPLGFLSSETLDCPGNFGLKDQVEMLRWVQKNIAAFGGDPNSVTIFGNSAGSASVTYQLISNSTKGLFHKAIAQSGTYFCPWGQPEHKGIAAKRAREMAQMVGCNPDEKWQKLLRCLRTKNADDIVATLYEFFEWDFDPAIPFQPVVEPPHKDAFLTASPRDTDIPHGFSLPLIIGITSEEGLLKTAPILNLPGLLDEYKTQFHTILPIQLQYDHHSAEVREEITKKIEDFYFKEGHTYDKYNHQNFTDLLSDGMFVVGVDEYIHQRVEAQNSLDLPPFYVYIFEHRAPASLTELFEGGSEDFYGVCHAEELQYLFPVGLQWFVSATPTEDDVKLREAILQMWVNFATEGNPTPTQSALPQWEPVKGYPVNYAQLGHKSPEEFTILQMERDVYGNRIKFWQQLQAHIPAEQRKRKIRDEL
ncbi:venom carboxylesterase-6-like [Anastrepha obliqua]|uniref:venom carboxylesterase-6-like n=1 Tax=Anastrepha obliqua TaxID=95512 RepID=UPI002408F701|nr:venom carboxylesterase-6-like [Anastrepha obliqua]